jgi:hypothetical protein
MFRGKFLHLLRDAFARAKLRFCGNLKPLAAPGLFDRFTLRLKEIKWVVYAKPPMDGPEHVVNYLARYTHRVAIANGRIIDFAEGRVTFRWRDSSDGNKQKLITLDAVEFIRRYLLHVLPCGFMKTDASASWQTGIVAQHWQVADFCSPPDQRGSIQSRQSGNGRSTADVPFASKGACSSSSTLALATLHASTHHPRSIHHRQMTQSKMANNDPAPMCILEVYAPADAPASGRVCQWPVRDQNLRSLTHLIAGKAPAHASSPQSAAINPQ